MEEIKEQLKQMDGRIDNIDKTLIRQEEHLKQHMIRSDMNEKAINIIVQELKPIKEHVLIVKFVIKFLTWILGSSIVLLILQHYL